MPLIFYIAVWMLQALVYLVLVGAILSWFPAARKSAFAKLVHSINAPLLMPFRALLPPIAGMDFSPVLAILLLHFLKNLLAAA